jgi:DNA-nicking Smr family endonuclease
VKQKPPGKGRAKRAHTDDDDVWQHTAQTVEPLKRSKGRVHPAVARITDDIAASLRDSPTVPAKSASAKVRVPQPASSQPVPQPPLGRKPVAPPLAEFDRKKVRKIRSGQVEIEARIDLHGLRQDEAHQALRTFVHRCVGKGQRWVLVITGKGKTATARDDAPFDMMSNRDRGVLKRNVPRWLDEPDLRVLIVSYTTASLQHGGEGALYVHLRTKRRL